MQKNLVFILLVFVCANIYSQNVTVQLSPDLNDEGSNPEVIGMNDQSFFVISSKSEKLLIHRKLSAPEPPI